MLFEVFTGDRLVDEQDQATLWARVLNPKHRPPRSVLPSLPPEIDEMIMRAVAVEPKARFGNAAEMQRFADKLRTPDSKREAFVKYLRYLYPKLDFAEPPVPDFGDLGMVGTDRSLIIATSREGQRSVFGRGDLPIEGTTTINAEELRRAFKNRQSREVATDPHITEKAPRVIETFPEPQRLPVAEDMIQPTGPNRPASGPSGAGILAIDGPTQIAHIPMSPEMDFDEETRAASPMVRDVPSQNIGRDFREEMRGRKDSLDDHSDHTLEAAPVRGLRPDSMSYRDDEMTVMMDAPPRHLTEDSDEAIPAASSDATKLSRFPKPDVVKVTSAPSAPKPGPGRAREIKEKVSAHNRQDRNEARAAVPAKQQRANQQNIKIHRQTVPIESTPPMAAGAQNRNFDHGSQGRGFGPEMTEPELPPQEGNGLLLPGLILFGLAVMIVILVLILLRMS